MRERAVRGSLVVRIIAVAMLAGSVLLVGCDSKEVRACKDECPIEVVVVCAADGKEYANECEAKCYGMTEYTQGPCKISK